VIWGRLKNIYAFFPHGEGFGDLKKNIRWKVFSMEDGGLKTQNGVNMWGESEILRIKS